MLAHGIKNRTSAVPRECMEAHDFLALAVKINENHVVSLASVCQDVGMYPAVHRHLKSPIRLSRRGGASALSYRSLRRFDLDGVQKPDGSINRASKGHVKIIGNVVPQEALLKSANGCRKKLEVGRPVLSQINVVRFVKGHLKSPIRLSRPFRAGAVGWSGERGLNALMALAEHSRFKRVHKSLFVVTAGLRALVLPRLCQHPIQGGLHHG
jgi:hypothetical protein